MDRRYFIGSLATLAGTSLVGAPGRPAARYRRSHGAPPPGVRSPASTSDPDWEPLELSEGEWREVLTEEEPTGERWCNNGLALDFVPAGEDRPELRT